LSDVRESTNRVKKGVMKQLFSERGVFVVKKRSYMTFLTDYKDAKNLENMVDD